MRAAAEELLAAEARAVAEAKAKAKAEAEAKARAEEEARLKAAAIAKAKADAEAAAAAAEAERKSHTSVIMQILGQTFNGPPEPLSMAGRYYGDADDQVWSMHISRKLFPPCDPSRCRIVLTAPERSHSLNRQEWCV